MKPLYSNIIATLKKIIDDKVNSSKTTVVQNLGTSSSDVMSQGAVTTELKKKQDLISMPLSFQKTIEAPFGHIKITTDGVYLTEGESGMSDVPVGTYLSLSEITVKCLQSNTKPTTIKFGLKLNNGWQSICEWVIPANIEVGTNLKFDGLGTIYLQSSTKDQAHLYVMQTSGDGQFQKVGSTAQITLLRVNK